MAKDSNSFYMEIALSLARKGLGRTSPNPPVGAVIVKGGKIIGKGYHKKAGEPHAEVLAIEDSNKYLTNSTLYVTLEPCSHYGRTPPCTDAIIKSGIKRVVIGTLDPNPIESGAGLERMKKAGIDVKVGILESECKNLIEAYSKYITTGIPFIAIKWAMSIDGKIATKTGDSKWLSSKPAIEFSHHLRDIYDAVAVGIGTVFVDNPLLTCRIDGGRNPVRLIFDTNARLLHTSNIVKTIGEARTILIHSKSAVKENLLKLKDKGIETIEVETKDGKVDILEALRQIGSLEITSILVEGGGSLIGSFVESKEYDKVFVNISPIIIGGREALSPVMNIGVEKVGDAIRLDRISYLFKGDDIIVVGYKRK